MVSIISILSTAVAVLWRNHLSGDERERKRADVAESDSRALVAELRRALAKSLLK